MKKLLLIFLFPIILQAQLLTLCSDDVNYFALDFDGSTEYAYINNPTGLDLNSANYLSGADDDFTATYVSDFSSETLSVVNFTANNNQDAISDGIVSKDDCLLLITTGVSTGFAQIVGAYPSGQYHVKIVYYFTNTTDGVDGIALVNNQLTTMANFKSTGSNPLAVNSWDSISVTFNFTQGTNQNLYLQLTDGSSAEGNQVDSIYIAFIQITPTNWSNLTYTGTKATFSSSATLATSYLSTAFESGKNYTVQLKASSVSSSDLKIKVGTDSTTKSTTGTEATKAWTFTYDSGTQVELIGNGTDTYTIDDVDVSEAYDLEIDGWFNTSNTTSDMYYFSKGSEYSNTIGYSIRFYSNGLIYSRINGDYNVNVFTYNISSYRDGGWHKINSKINRLIKNNHISIDDNVIINSTFNEIGRVSPSYPLVIGASQSVNTRFNGQIGTITFTRTNGLGQIVSTSVYDWSGTADTFLDDKGTNGNDLTGVNITTDDVVEYKGGYSE